MSSQSRRPTATSLQSKGRQTTSSVMDATSMMTVVVTFGTSQPLEVASVLKLLLARSLCLFHGSLSSGAPATLSSSNEVIAVSEDVSLGPGGRAPALLVKDGRSASVEDVVVLFDANAAVR